MITNRATNYKAFTLVELLVVIGVIAVLISILLPVLSSTRESANRIKCSSNLRQIGICEYIYATANRGWIHPTYLTNGGNYAPNYWQKDIFDNYYAPSLGMISKIMLCPSDKYQTFAVSGWMPDPYWPTAYWNTSYQYLGNPTIGAGISYWPAVAQSPRRISSPGGSDAYVAGDVIYMQQNNSGFGGMFTPHAIGDPQSTGGILVLKRILGVNQLFLDGHVSWKATGQFPTQVNYGSTPPGPGVNLRFQANDAASAAWIW